MDPSLANLVKKMFPLCTNFISISKFVEKFSRFEAGVVAQAFCAVLKELLKEYYVLVAQLENEFLQNRLTLQKLWFYLQSSIQTMKQYLFSFFLFMKLKL